jgi:hypothetical protein
MALPHTPPRTPGPPEAWQPTLQAGGAPTQILADGDGAGPDTGIGRRVGPGLWELFVVYDPAQALAQQFDLHPEPCVALHDIGSPQSRRWLAEIATAHRLAPQRLVVRSQGWGVALATIHFLELPVATGAPLRLYSTDVDAETRQRQAIARVLLGASRIGAVLVGDLPGHALAAALQPLHDAIATGPWRNRELLLMPTRGTGVLARHADAVTEATPVRSRVTPTVADAEDALAATVEAWNDLHAPLAGAGVATPIVTLAVRQRAPTPPAATPAAPLAPPVSRSTATPPPLPPLQPLPLPRAAQAGAEPLPPLQRYAQRCLEIKGMVSCCIFELDTQRTLAHAGARPGPAALAANGAALCAALAAASRGLGLGAAPPEAAVTLAGHYLVLRPLPRQPRLVLHAVIDRSATPLVLALRHLERIDDEPASR